MARFDDLKEYVDSMERDFNQFYDERQQSRWHACPQRHAGPEEDGPRHPCRGSGKEERRLGSSRLQTPEGCADPGVALSFVLPEYLTPFVPSTSPCTAMLRFTPLLLLLSLLALAGPAFAQEEDEPLTETEGWRSNLTGQLAFSQAAYSNWQEGGLDALSFTTGVTGRFQRLIGEFKQTHSTRLAYGVVKQDTLQFRKSDDVIRYAFELQYTGTGVFQPTFATDIRTQFTSGFDYDPDAATYPVLDSLGFLVPRRAAQGVGLLRSGDLDPVARHHLRP